MTRFQSTRPVWGVTRVIVVVYFAVQISIHTPRVGRDQRVLDVVALFNISIHTPRVGRDKWLREEFEIVDEFQSTRPVWGVTRKQHAALSGPCDFNPHAPCGA